MLIVTGPGKRFTMALWKLNAKMITYRNLKQSVNNQTI